MLAKADYFGMLRCFSTGLSTEFVNCAQISVDNFLFFAVNSVQNGIKNRQFTNFLSSLALDINLICFLRSDILCPPQQKQICVAFHPKIEFENDNAVSFAIFYVL